MDLARLDHIPTVKVGMTPFPHAVEIDAPLSVARAMMSEHDVHQLPVIENGRLIGVVADREVELVTESTKGRPRAVRVRDACTTRVPVIEDGERLDRALERMASEHVAAALVVRRGKLVGIFTFTDACRLFAEWLRARFPDPEDGAAA
jgi:acetoin utilization protein AcuB